jgi:glucose/arabinose dehydrogenase
MATLERLTRRPFVALALVGLLAAGCTDDDGSSSAAPAGEAGLPAAEVVATGIEAPWGVAFLPGGDALVAERDTGRILQVRPGAPLREVMKLTNVRPTGEAGLLGLAVSPTYATDQLVYAYYTAATDNRIVRFRLGGAEEVVLQGIAKASLHDGGRLAFGPDGMLYATTGDATVPATAQDRNSRNGKILRMRPDGSPPPDNPSPGSVVYSYGHRNVQGIAWDQAGRLWASEFGANERDELNLIRPGANYGWPAVEGEGGSDGGLYTDPVVTWSTAEASPSGIAYWRGALYLAALRGQRLWRVPVDGQGRAGRPQALLEGNHGRLRTVVVAPDGSLWVTTSNRDGRGQVRDGDDRILRFPAP